MRLVFGPFLEWDWFFWGGPTVSRRREIRELFHAVSVVPPMDKMKQLIETAQKSFSTLVFHMLFQVLKQHETAFGPA